jgi:predicted oxidoreductase
VIIGGGLAGIVAALDLLEAGKRVVLLDRDEAEKFGGLARESFGGIFIVGSREQRLAGIKDSPELALRDWLSFGEIAADDVWPRRWAEAYVYRCHLDVSLWLRARGIGFFPVPHWVERGLDVPGNSVPRFHMVWGTGQALALQLIRRLEAHRNRALLDLRFGHRAEALLTENGRVTGCRGVTEQGAIPFEARGEHTIIAAGGQNGGDLAKVRSHWHRDWRRPPNVLLNGSHRFADGRLHDAVAAAGGTLTHLDRMWNYAAGVHHYQPRKPNHGLSLVPPRSALWLNWRGERIMPPLLTGFDTRQLVSAICNQERQYSWQLLNHAIAAKELAVSGAEHNPSVRDKKAFSFLRELLFGNTWLVNTLTKHCEDIVTAGTLPELVAKMNRLQGDDAVKLDVVSATVRNFDAQVALGAKDCSDGQLKRIAQLRQWRGDKIRTCNFQPILDPKAGPLMAIREFIISRKSLGGIQTDLGSRALDGSGEPIAGLYATGEAAGFGGGGMHGLRALEGSFLGGCVLTARIAADTIIHGG